MRGEVIGVAAFIRVQQRNFPPSELAILKDVSRALSIATANALANEEIRKLREQLEAEIFPCANNSARRPGSKKSSPTPPN